MINNRTVLPELHDGTDLNKLIIFDSRFSDDIWDLTPIYLIKARSSSVNCINNFCRK